MPLLLGSQSKGRKFVLENAGIKFETYATSTIELSKNGQISKEQAIALVIKNSGLKMDSVLKAKDLSFYNIYITADTVVWFNDKIYGKPKDKKEAKYFLNEFSGKSHYCISGVTVCIKEEINKFSRKELSDISEVKISSNKTLIDNYLKYDEYIGKAGAYAIQGKGSILIDEIRGNVQNIMGLPLASILNYLSKANYFSLLEFK